MGETFRDTAPSDPFANQNRAAPPLLRVRRGTLQRKIVRPVIRPP
jgi:hypothetical protein